MTFHESVISLHLTFIMLSWNHELTNESKQYAEQYLNEHSQIRDSTVNEIRKYLESNPDINAKCDYNNILMFLRCCKFDVEKTKVKIKNFYAMKARTVEWFANRDPNLPEIDELLKIGVFVPVIPKNPGPLIVVIRIAAHNPHKHFQNNVFKTGKSNP